jgi:hypothetical protein
MFMLKNLKIEAKRTRSIVWKFISKRSEHVYIQNLNIEAKRSKFTLNCESSEAKRTYLIVKKIYFEAKRTCLYKKKNLNIKVIRTDSLVRKFISKRSEHVYIKDFKYWSEAKQVNIKMWI